MLFLIQILACVGMLIIERSLKVTELFYPSQKVNYVRLIRARPRIVTQYLLAQLSPHPAIDYGPSFFMGSSDAQAGAYSTAGYSSRNCSAQDDGVSFDAARDTLGCHNPAPSARSDLALYVPPPWPPYNVDLSLVFFVLVFITSIIVVGVALLCNRRSYGKVPIQYCSVLSLDGMSEAEDIESLDPASPLYWIERYTKLQQHHEIEILEMKVKKKDLRKKFRLQKRYIQQEEGKWYRGRLRDELWEKKFAKLVQKFNTQEKNVSTIIQRYELSIAILEFDDSTFERAEKEAEEAEKLRYEGIRKRGPMPNMNFSNEYLKPKVPVLREPPQRPFRPEVIRSRERQEARLEAMTEDQLLTEYLKMPVGRRNISHINECLQKFRNKENIDKR